MLLPYLYLVACLLPKSLRNPYGKCYAKQDNGYGSYLQKLCTVELKIKKRSINPAWNYCSKKIENNWYKIQDKTEKINNEAYGSGCFDRAQPFSYKATENCSQQKAIMTTAKKAETT
jgi:hypothetical protein